MGGVWNRMGGVSKGKVGGHWKGWIKTWITAKIDPCTRIEKMSLATTVGSKTFHMVWSA